MVFLNISPLKFCNFKFSILQLSITESTNFSATTIFLLLNSKTE